MEKVKLGKGVELSGEGRNYKYKQLGNKGIGHVVKWGKSGRRNSKDKDAKAGTSKAYLN